MHARISGDGKPMTALLQLDPPIPVETEHGPGMALVAFDYGPNINSVFLVALQRSRELKHYASPQLKIAVNFTMEYL